MYVFRHDIPTADIERTFSYICAIEGICEWSTHEAALTQPDKFDPESIHKHRSLMMHGGRDPEEESLSIMFDLFVNSVELFSAALKNTEFGGGLSAEAIKRLSIARYYVGYYFIHTTMSLLSEKGINMSNRLHFIITNPPENIHELRHPQDYMKRVLSANGHNLFG